MELIDIHEYFCFKNSKYHVVGIAFVLDVSVTKRMSHPATCLGVAALLSW